MKINIRGYFLDYSKNKARMFFMSNSAGLNSVFLKDQASPLQSITSSLYTQICI